jgi:hypothetical protein
VYCSWKQMRSYLIKYSNRKSSLLSRFNWNGIQIFRRLPCAISLVVGHRARGIRLSRHAAGSAGQGETVSQTPSTAGRRHGASHTSLDSSFVGSFPCFILAWTTAVVRIKAVGSRALHRKRHDLFISLNGLLEQLKKYIKGKDLKKDWLIDLKWVKE